MKRRKVFISAAIMTVVITLAMCVTAYADGDILKRGSKSDEVVELQSLLTDLGYFDYDTATGYYGKITEDAVKAFQTDNGLKVDGITGSETWAALFSEEPAEEGEEASYDTEQTLSRGMEGEAVEDVQIRLQELGLYTYERITGYFGSITENAVLSFQRAYGLEQDGIVGPETYSYLFSQYKETSLIPGMVNDDVTELQQRLADLGYYTYTVDGSYGAKTREAVMYFQRAHGLTVDGIAGSATSQVLFSASAMDEQEARRMLTTSGQEDSSDDDSSTQAASTAQGTAGELLDYAYQYLGAPYVYAASGPDSFDCTGFTCYVFSHFGISLPRSAYDQGYTDYGIKITDPDQLEPGDIVFFNTVDDGDLSDHAGIYIGDGDFIHAASGSSMKVVISNMFDSQYYAARFSWARRVLS